MNAPWFQIGRWRPFAVNVKELFPARKHLWSIPRYESKANRRGSCPLSSWTLVHFEPYLWSVTAPDASVWVDLSRQPGKCSTSEDSWPFLWTPRVSSSIRHLLDPTPSTLSSIISRVQSCAWSSLFRCGPFQLSGRFPYACPHSLRVGHWSHPWDLQPYLSGHHGAWVTGWADHLGSYSHYSNQHFNGLFCRDFTAFQHVFTGALSGFVVWGRFVFGFSNAPGSYDSS